MAKMDGSLNAVQGVSVRGYPTVYLFPAGSREFKRENKIQYTGDRTLESLISFLIKNKAISNYIGGASGVLERDGVVGSDEF